MSVSPVLSTSSFSSVYIDSVVHRHLRLGFTWHSRFFYVRMSSAFYRALIGRITSLTYPPTAAETAQYLLVSRHGKNGKETISAIYRESIYRVVQKSGNPVLILRQLQ